MEHNVDDDAVGNDKWRKRRVGKKILKCVQLIVYFCL